MGVVNRDGALWMSTGIDNSGLYSGLNDSERRIDQFEAHIKKVGNNIMHLTGVGFGIAGLKAFGNELVNVRGEIQMLESSFDVLLGGNGLSEFMTELKQFAVDSPLSLSGVSNAAQMLMAFGVEAEKVIPVVKQLGDISMGNEEKFRSLALAYSQMTSAGKVLSQDLRQMATAGFNPLGEIARTTGKSIQEVTELMDKGQISVDQVAEAFISATAEGGKFYGMTQKQAEGIKGLQAQLEGGIQDAFNDLGKSQEGLITGGYSVAISLVENYKTVGEALMALVATYGVAKAAMVFDNAIDKTVKNVRITEESKSLESLISTEQKAVISKQNLTKGTVEYASAVKAAALANVNSAKEQVAALGREASAQNTAMISAKQRAAFASEIVVQRKAELAAIIGTAEAERVASLQKKMAVESEKQSRAALLAVKLQEKKDAAIIQAQALKESQATEQKINAKNREIAVIHNKIIAAKAEEIQYSQNVAAIRSEMKAASSNIASKQVETAQKRLNTAVTQENTAVTERNAAMKAFYSQKAKIQTASQVAATLATKVDTAASTANVTATNFLSAAKVRLITVSKGLWAAIAPNPYVLAAAAAVALGYGIYKLATYTTEAKKATNEYNKSVASERALLDILVSRFNSTEKGTKEYEEAKKNLNNKYGEALSSINLEIDALHRNKTGYELLTAEIEKNTRAKIRNKYTEQFAEESGEEVGKYYAKIRNRILSQIQGDAGNEVLNSVKQIIENSDVSTRGWDLDKQFKELGLKWTDYSKDVYSILSSQRNLKEKIAEIDEIFSFSESAKKDTNKTVDEFITLEEQVTKAKSKVTELKIELDNLQKGIKPTSVKDGEQFDFAKGIEDKAKALKEAEDKLNLLLYGKSTSDIGKGESAAEKARKEAQAIAEQKDQLNQLLNKQALDRKRAEEDLANQATQASIDAEQNKSEKIRRQREHDYDMEVQSLIRQKEDYIQKILQAEKEIFDKQEDIKAKENKNYEKKVFDPSSISIDTSHFNKLINESTAKQVTSEKDRYKLLLEEFQSYQDKYTAAQKQFDDKKKELEAGKTAENAPQVDRSIEELEYKREETLNSINEEFASREETYQSWLNEVANLSLTQLQNLLVQAKSELDKMKAAGANGKEVAVASAQVEHLKNQIAGMNLTPKQRTIKEWGELHSVLNDVNDSFQDIGDEVGGTAGEIIRAAGGIASSVMMMVDGIVTLANSSNSAMVGTSQAASKSIQAVEKASVILAVIAAALQIAMKIANFLSQSHDKKKEKEIKRLQEQVDALEKSYEKLGRSIDKAYSKNAVRLIKQQDEALRKQQILIKQQIREEEGKKKSDKNRIKEWKEEIEKIDLILEENKEKAVDAIFGQDIKSAIEDFADAYAEAWAAGEDRAQASKDFVKNMIKQMIIEAMKMDISAPMQKIRDKLNRFWEDGFISINEEAMINAMVDELQKDLDEKYAWADKYLSDSDKDTRSSEAKGFAQASQDSVDQLVGLANVSVEHSRWILEKNTSMEEHLREMKTDYRAAQNTINSILSHTRNIDSNTSGMLEAIRKMRADINSLVTKGITLKK